MKFEVNKDLFPFGNHFVTLADGSNIHYVDEGTGDVLLMFHGNPSWSFLYRKMISTLKPHFRCIAFDYPGFGLSEAPAGYDFLPRTHSTVAEEFITTLGLEQVTVICQDWGGPESGQDQSGSDWQYVGVAFGGRSSHGSVQLVYGWANWPMDGAIVQWGVATFHEGRVC